MEAIVNYQKLLARWLIRVREKRNPQGAASLGRPQRAGDIPKGYRSSVRTPMKLFSQGLDGRACGVVLVG